jgi:hypothetical protein
VDSAAEVFRLVRPDTELVAVDEHSSSIGGRHRGHGCGPRRPGHRRGTDTDFRGEAFGSWKPDGRRGDVDKLRPSVHCGDLATRSSGWWTASPPATTLHHHDRRRESAGCRHCHRVPRKDEDQTALL